MADVQGIMQPFINMPQPDMMGAVRKVQEVQQQQQVLETNRRGLDSQKAGGDVLRQITDENGGIDYPKGLSLINALPPELRAGAQSVVDAAAQSATATQKVGAEFAQGQVDYFGTSAAGLLFSHPGGFTMKEANDFIADMNAHKAITPQTATAFHIEMMQAKTDLDRRRKFIEYTTRTIAQSPQGLFSQVTLTGKDKKPFSVPYISFLQKQAMEAGGEPAADALAEHEASDTGVDVPGAVSTGISAAETTGAEAASKVDYASVDRDLAAAEDSPNRVTSLRNLMAEHTQYKGGPFTSIIEEALGAANQLTPGSPFAPEMVAAMEAAEKDAALLAQQQAAAGLGAAATDMGRGMALRASPRADMSALGLEIVAHQVLGNEAAITVKSLLEREMMLENNGVIPPGKLNEFKYNWQLHGGPRIFQFEMQSTDRARNELLGAARVAPNKTNKKVHWESFHIDPTTGKDVYGARPLTEGQQAYLDDFMQDYDYADEHGWFQKIEPSLKQGL